MGRTVIGAEVFVLVPVPRYVECSDQPPLWNLSLARVWFVPSVQFAASAAPPVPAVSKPGFSTRLPLTGVFVMVGVGVLVGVLVGTMDVCVAVGVFVTGTAPTSEISSNQMSPVGEPSVIRRSVTLVFDPLFHVPVRNCQLPEVLVQS